MLEFREFSRKRLHESEMKSGHVFSAINSVFLIFLELFQPH